MKRKLVSPYSSHGGRELIYFFTMDFLDSSLHGTPAGQTSAYTVATMIRDRAEAGKRGLKQKQAGPYSDLEGWSTCIVSQ